MRAAIRRVFEVAWCRSVAFVVLLALGTVAAASLALPNVHWKFVPETEHLRLLSAQADRWKCDGKPRLVVRTTLQAAAFPKGLPETLVVDVQLDAGFQQSWEIWRLDLIEVDGAGQDRIVESVQCVDNPASRLHAKEYLTGIRPRGASYAVVVYLHAQREVDEQSIHAAKQAVMEGRGVTIKDVPQNWSQPLACQPLCSPPPSCSPR